MSNDMKFPYWMELKKVREVRRLEALKEQVQRERVTLNREIFKLRQKDDALLAKFFIVNRELRRAKKDE